MYQYAQMKYQNTGYMPNKLIIFAPRYTLQIQKKKNLMTIT